MFPERFSNLPEYAFPRLRSLLDVHEPGGDRIEMTIGEPRHAFPDWIGEVLAESWRDMGRYPPNDGTAGMRGAFAGFLSRRYGVEVDPDTRLLPLNGTREGLFNTLLALCPETKNGQRPAVLMPNPFYQVYAVATLTVAAEPVFVPAEAETGFLPDYAGLDPALLDRTAVIYVCSPSNPQGAVASRAYWAELLRLAEKHDFRIFADECYSEIYRDAPPPGVLEALAETGADPERVVAFHSLSKRSNLPGIRSGFAVAGPRSMTAMKRLRAYGGAPLPLPLQHVAEKVWQDEEHVEASRALYQQKYRLADDILGDVPGYHPPEAGFFLWLPVEDGEAAALKLWQQTGVRVLPGAYLGREVDGHNPGAGYIRVALVVDQDEMQRGLTSLRDCLYG
ncbi:aspartate aminotransferase [Brevirhabdus pacifica]|uniref:Aspartate aminotransferase n=1 Tax=Brevirhabdus pacifica TaxID=1267768 RepID=A0A1U7DIE4_9RHOB|nr:aminotransferase class I/II-fold pyridoxal phosphate-dependent enzyme [Brevirhabdus pacifica]APX89731.1 aspartate aminotransferase [Brevirhabdus pacifica]OWU74569.1 aspartate aminotransferase [Loktanella sp. 22II-4b]PJJ85578.1 aspartate/methionine/tyrosine aminotransferase [Brevirhabdus pacifica]